MSSMSSCVCMCLYVCVCVCMRVLRMLSVRKCMQDYMHVSKHIFAVCGLFVCICRCAQETPAANYITLWLREECFVVFLPEVEHRNQTTDVISFHRTHKVWTHSYDQSKAPTLVSPVQQQHSIVNVWSKNVPLFIRILPRRLVSIFGVTKTIDSLYADTVRYMTPLSYLWRHCEIYDVTLSTVYLLMLWDLWRHKL